MAKKTTRRSVKMVTTKDLLEWLSTALGPEWTIHVDEQTTLKIDSYSRSTEVRYSYWIRRAAWGFMESGNASTVPGLARHFQAVSWPKIEAEWNRRNPKPVPKAIESHQRKLNYSIPLASEVSGDNCD